MLFFLQKPPTNTQNVYMKYISYLKILISSNKAVTKINPTNCFHVLSLLSFFIITLLTIKYLQYRAQRY